MSATASLSCHAKVICALALCDADALATLLAEPGVRDAVHSMDVPAPVAARLAAGDCVSACRRRHPRWLLLLESAHLQQAVLRMLLARSLQGVLRSGYELGGVLVLLAAMVGAADALGHFAASLQAGRLPAEYRQLAEDVVATACMAPDAEGGVLRCLVRLAAAAAKGLQPAGPLAAHLGSELAACLSGAAQEGRLGELAALLAAGVLVTPEALRAAIAGGSEEVLALLLRHGTPPAEPLPAGTILTLPSGGGGVGGRCQYTCPLLFLLGAHAAKGHEALHPQDLAMAELLVAAGYSPSSYSSVLVRGEEEAWLAPHLCPALQDEGLDVRGRGRYLSLAATAQPWCHATHSAYPPAFHRAAVALLLAAHRAGATAADSCGADDCSGPPAALGRLQMLVLEDILRVAARPLSTWAAAPWESAAAWMADWQRC